MVAQARKQQDAASPRGSMERSEREQPVEEPRGLPRRLHLAIQRLQDTRREVRRQWCFGKIRQDAAQRILAFPEFLGARVTFEMCLQAGCFVGREPPSQRSF